MKLSPSLLSANFYNIENDLNILRSENIKYLHLDVMDGIFVPNISFGIPVIKKFKEFAKDFIFDTHLMITKPERFLKEFKEAGADILTIHKEASGQYIDTLKRIREMGMMSGLSVNPETDIESISDALPYCDLVLVMSVHPGFSGQKFIEDSLKKVSWLKAEKEKNKYKYIIEIDGGINKDNIKKASDTGAELIVAGNAVFKGDIKNNLKEINIC